MVNADSLKKGLMVLVIMIGIVVALYALLMIGGLVVGSIANVAVSGSVPVSTGMNTSLAGFETSYITDSGAIADNSGLIIALVAVVVVILVFGIKFNFGGGAGKRGVE